MQFDVDKLLSEFTTRTDSRPWGFMQVLDAPEQGLTVKYLRVLDGCRTSLQKHEHKDELIFVIEGDGNIDVGCVRYRGVGRTIRIRPGVKHRVTGPLIYLEVSSYDDGLDTIRLEDDYGRA